MKAILFDLDGTLLPVKKLDFTQSYFKKLIKKFSSYNLNGEELTNAMWESIDDMCSNDGSLTNETIFWNSFSSKINRKKDELEQIISNFYEKDFDSIKVVCGFLEEPNNTIKYLKQLGYKLVLASNPVFPKVAQECRIKWAGVNPNDFDLITSYENSHYCKPNLKYYEEILSKINCLPEDCIMVGNDVTEDMVASNLGLKTFLITHSLINKNNADISKFNNGDFNQLLTFIKSLDNK